VVLGFYLIFVGLAVILLDWLCGRSDKEGQSGEIKFGSSSIKGSAGILILLLGVLIYLLEEDFLNLKT
jgi:hypothetical protein